MKEIEEDTLLRASLKIRAETLFMLLNNIKVAFVPASECLPLCMTAVDYETSFVFTVVQDSFVNLSQQQFLKHVILGSWICFVFSLSN